MDALNIIDLSELSLGEVIKCTEKPSITVQFKNIKKTFNTKNINELSFN